MDLKRSNTGFSLINIMMGVGILSIGSVGLLRFTSSQVSSVSNLETIREISAFQRKIARKMSLSLIHI